MKTVNVHEAKTHLSRLLEQTAAGDTIVIAKAGKPMAVLSAWQPATQDRQGGGWQDQVWVSDDFDAPSAELESIFYGTGTPEIALRAAEKPGQ